MWQQTAITWKNSPTANTQGYWVKYNPRKEGRGRTDAGEPTLRPYWFWGCSSTLQACILKSQWTKKVKPQATRMQTDGTKTLKRIGILQGMTRKIKRKNTHLPEHQLWGQSCLWALSGKNSPLKNKIPNLSLTQDSAGSSKWINEQEQCPWANGTPEMFRPSNTDSSTVTPHEIPTDENNPYRSSGRTLKLGIHFQQETESTPSKTRALGNLG